MDVDDACLIRLLPVDGPHVDLRKVDASQGDSLGNISDESLADLNADATLCFFGTATDMWSEDDVLQAAQVICPAAKGARIEVVAVRTRLIGIDVNGSPGNFPA